MAPTWLSDAVAAFGKQCQTKLHGGGEPEAAIRSPIEALIGEAGLNFQLTVVPYDEYRDTERAVRPDYAVSVNGAITGYIEVKRPGQPLDPASFTGHNRTQWNKLKDLPNLLYTNGTEWRLWRDGDLLIGPVYFTGGSLESAGAQLEAPHEFETLLRRFFDWKPQPITAVTPLVNAVAPLTRLLRSEVLDQLAEERRRIAAGDDEFGQPFTGLARDWRMMLFPAATDEVFADGYAQAVTFALLLARTENIALDGPIHQVGEQLGGASHTLMGRALQLLTDNVAADFKVSLDLLVRVVAAVNWPRIRASRRDAYLHLYEHFLDVYDPELRRQSGSYYTPHQVVEQMVRLADDALVSVLGKASGFADPGVTIVDPAMGTGTYLHTIVDRVAKRTAEREGQGAVPGVVTRLLTRLIGFELQMGPYAVAELRTSDLVRELRATAPRDGLRLYVTDTLDDPHAQLAQLGSGMELIAQSRRRANQVKADEHVTVVIGNPPYKELAVGDGGWVEAGGSELANATSILEGWLAGAPARSRAKLKNLYIYFWRWATWKVWESTKADDAGVVCFISTSGYVTGLPFAGMREYLRRYATDGWIIDLTPEGQRPEVATRIFPTVQQPLAIGLFVRTPGKSREEPATIRYRHVEGRQEDKFAQLAALTLDDDGWREVRTDWTAPMTPAGGAGWDTMPAISDLMPWYSPGVFPTRTWVYAPAAEILNQRWSTLTGSTPAQQPAMFKEGRDASLTQTRAPLPGTDTYQGTQRPVSTDTGRPTPIRVGYRAFDRQWVLPDRRLMDMPRPELWSARLAGQVFVSELHTKPVTSGPGLAFSALITDNDYFKGSGGGRVLPYLHPNGQPNVTPGLLAALAVHVSGLMSGTWVTAADLLAYVAAVVSHPGYTATFADQLTTPGIRIPLTARQDLWDEAVQLGRHVLWCQTYGAAFADAAEGRPHDDIRFPSGDPRRVLHSHAVTAMPDTISYDPDEQTVIVGTGRWTPVPEAAFTYTVAGRGVVNGWFNYRKANPTGRRTSPLDDIHVETWPGEWSVELTDLLSVLTRLVEAEPAQADLLERITAGPLLGMETLTAAGVRWPQNTADRRPHHDVVTADSDSDDGLLPFG